jgi:hypothetical protein
VIVPATASGSLVKQPAVIPGRLAEANPESIAPQIPRPDGFRACAPFAAHPGMTADTPVNFRHTFSFPRRDFSVRVLQNLVPPREEGAGNAGRANAPAASRASERKHASKVTAGTPEEPGISRAMVLRFPS